MTSDGTGAAPAAYALLEVVETGPLALVEDRGRTGLGSIGVSPSGAADLGAFALGARLLGQGPEQAAIECLGGLVLRARTAVTVALTGAPCPTTSGGRGVGHAAPFLLAAGDELRLGRPTHGLRTYVSVRGGFVVDEVLESRSRDTLSQLGPPPLAVGQLLPVGHPVGDPLVDVAPVPAPATGLVTLEALPGPRLDWLEGGDALTRTTWTVGPDSDRVGLRLHGDPLSRTASHESAELPSEGVTRGAVQVPADGQPVVFGADHPVTGGYPVVAVLTQESSDRAAQLVPGQPVRLRLLGSPRAR
jgi:biotin-dependent carboxylase-like uncharacterized protein